MVAVLPLCGYKYLISQFSLGHLILSLPFAAIFLGHFVHVFPPDIPPAAVTKVPWGREGTRNLHPQVITNSAEQQQPEAVMESVSK